MYWQYVLEEIVYYAFRLAVFAACIVYIVDVAKKWARKGKKRK